MSERLVAADAVELGRHVEPLAVVYRRCFAEPPWNESEEQLDRFPEQLATDLKKPGAHGFLKWSDGQLVGVAYGWPTAKEPDSPFYTWVYGAVDPEEHDLLRYPALQVAELMVDPDHRGRGVGRALLGALAEEYEKAWLCTLMDAPARGLYESAGWRVIGVFEHDGRAMGVLSLSR